MALLCLAISGYSYENYYYSGGVQINLHEDCSKLVVLTSYNLVSNSLGVPGMTLSKTLSDDTSNVYIYDLAVTTDIETLHNQISQAVPLVNVISAYTNGEGLELVPTGYIYVKLKSPQDYALLQQVADSYECIIKDQNTFMPLWFTLSLIGKKDPVKIANSIYESGLFASSSPEFYTDIYEISYDPDVLEQWGLYNGEYEDIDISVSQAWNYSTGNGIKIAIIDQGIELTHVDLKNNIYHKSYDAYIDSSPSQIYSTTRSVGHGTHCAGIAAAVRNNGIQVAGVAPDAKLMSISCYLSTRNVAYQLARGINWAWKNGADIISCSWGGAEHDIIKEALDSAIVCGRNGKGCIIVKSAGNQRGAITFPGAYREEIIAVGNLQKHGVIHPTSCHGPNLLVCAPGTDILSTVLDNATGYKSGTSMACPHVSGVAALILQRNPELTANQVREIIARNTKKIGKLPYTINKKYGTWNEYYGYGLVDAYKAVINTPR